MSGSNKNQYNTIAETFPQKVCINLDRRPQRWRRMEREFARHGIYSVRRFPAIDGEKIQLPHDWMHTPGAYGCLRSHVEVVRNARNLGMSSVLIFEDDVTFHDDLKTKFAAGIADLPDDWDILFFGALHKEEPIRITDNLARITQANSTFACALKRTVFDAFIELNTDTTEVLDNNSLRLQQQFNCYCFMPHLAWVEADVSDAQQRLVDHWYLRESLVVFGAQVDRLLNETTVIFAHRTRNDSASATENLTYLLRYYDHYFSPNVQLIAVEQGLRPSVETASLPARCQYVFVPDAGSFNREMCFATGIKYAEPGRKRFILTDSDLYLETLHIRANLRMSERYDFISGFQTLIQLNQEDSVRLRAAKSPQGIDLTKNLSTPNSGESVCLFINRAAIKNIRQYDENLSAALSRVTAIGTNQSRSFQSPNHALRLH